MTAWIGFYVFGLVMTALVILLVWAAGSIGDVKAARLALLTPLWPPVAAVLLVKLLVRLIRTALRPDTGEGS